MKCLTIVLLAGVSAFAAHGQDSKAYTICSDGAKTQMEMNACASAEASRTDKELNDVYAGVLAIVARVPTAAAKVKGAERAWIAFRDAYIEAAYPAKDKQAEYGSMYVLEVSLLRAKLTRQQISALQDLRDRYTRID